ALARPPFLCLLLLCTGSNNESGARDVCRRLWRDLVQARDDPDRAGLAVGFGAAGDAAADHQPAGLQANAAGAKRLARTARKSRGTRPGTAGAGAGGARAAIRTQRRRRGGAPAGADRAGAAARRASGGNARGNGAGATEITKFQRRCVSASCRVEPPSALTW